MAIVELTKENFEQEVLACEVPVLIDFHADWCEPCKMQEPVIDEIAKEMEDKIKICKVNVDEQAALALNYQIVSIPTLVYMKYGIFQDKMIGLTHKETIVKRLNLLLEKEI